jgi:hypothetical protein
MPFIVPIVMVAGAAIAAYGSYQQGQQQKKAMEYSAKVDQQNALIAESDARAQSVQQDRENRLRIGAMRANMGASGGSGGSALDVLGDVAAQGELQKQFIMYSGAQQSRGYNNSAALDKFQGKAAAQSGTLRAGAELLSGAGAAGGAYYSRAPKLESVKSSVKLTAAGGGYGGGGNV